MFIKKQNLHLEAQIGGPPTPNDAQYTAWKTFTWLCFIFVA